MPKFMNLHNVLMNEAGDDGADGGGGAGGDGGDSGGVDVDDLQAQLADMQNQFKAVTAKNEELLTEAKRAKQAKREAEAAAEAEKMRLAQENNDYEQLFKSLEQKHSSLQSEYEGLQNNVANEKKTTAALKIATELADGPNVELLSEFLGRRLKYTDEGVKVTDGNGNLTVSTLDDLKKEFANDPRYSALLKGNQSSGGGASGGSNGGGAAKEISRADFNKLDPVAKMKFTKEGGKVFDS